MKVLKNCSASVFTRDTVQQAKVGVLISKAEARAGDLVFFSKASKINHVGIYLKDGKFAHASTTVGVTVSGLEDFIGRKHIRCPAVSFNKRISPRFHRGLS